MLIGGWVCLGMTYTAIYAQITGSDTAMPKAISAHGYTVP